VNVKSVARERKKRMRLRQLLRMVWFSAAILALCGGVHLLDAQDQAGEAVAPLARGMDARKQTRPAAPVTNPATADLELPGAVYNEAMHPLEVVRQSIENWSDSELAALSIGIHIAREACDRMKPEDYSKDDLYDLARLCAFGQDWNAANTAAQRYLDTHATEHMAQAFAISVSAFVHMNAPDLALATTRAMLRVEPYDAVTAYTVRYLKEDLEMAASPEAPKLAAEEHGKIIDALSKGTPLKAAHGNEVVNIGALYAMAMEAAFFARYAGDDAQAATYAGDVERALPLGAVLTGEDRQEIDSTNLQYRLLGSKLPRIPAIRSYKSATTKAQIDTNFGAATVLVVFPDWCTQCKKMMLTMTQFEAANADTPIRAYGLMFDEPGEEMAPETKKELRGTDVMEVSAETARSFGASDYPLGILVDRAGVIRFIGVLPSDAFDGGGYMGR
jgi:thiol-disulfide isomerase/thioredoxin